MRKNVIIYGLVAGAIVTSWMLAQMTGLFNNSYLEGGMLLGYTTMLAAFLLIFVCVKRYRDKENKGTITFGSAFRIGLSITLIASTIYVIVWLIDYYYFIPDYFEKYSSRLLEKMRTAGASLKDIQSKVAEMKSFGTMYKNPFMNALITYSEILPVGLVVSLLCALLLKRKESTRINDQHARGYTAG